MTHFPYLISKNRVYLPLGEFGIKLGDSPYFVSYPLHVLLEIMKLTLLIKYYNKNAWLEYDSNPTTCAPTSLISSFLLTETLGIAYCLLIQK